MLNASKVKKMWKTLQQEGFIEFFCKCFRYIKHAEIKPVINYYRNLFRFKAVAKPHKVIWVNSKTLKYCYRDDANSRNKYGVGAILNGDWDLNVETIDSKERLKKEGIIAHFEDGVPWEETALFKPYFTTKMKRGGTVRGFRNIQDLLNYYNDEIDSLYYSMKEHGVLLPSKGHLKTDFVYVSIGRKGELMYVNIGAHRLLIARYLNINHFPVRVWWRHKNWQEIRDELSTCSERERKKWPTAYLEHPDLADILQLHDKNNKK